MQTNDYILAVDPGASRTGFALYGDGIIITFSWSPWKAVEYVHGILGHDAEFEKVVLERWVPYPGAEHGNAWRELVEVLTLGAMEWECRRTETPYIYQQTSLLKVATAYADAKGYEWRAKNRDEKAAEAHLFYYRYLSEDNPNRQEYR